MKISSKGHYALRMLVDLAEHQNCGFISLKDISERQNLPKKYLEQIIPVLNKAKILKTTRGSQGGYKLAKSPGQYTAGEILRLTEGGLSPVDCFDEDEKECASCDESYICSFWKGLNSAINDYLNGVTLQDILDMKVEYYSNDYVI